MNKPLVVFLLESISQPRCIKRINSFIANGYDVEIYGIDRGKYNVNAVVEGKKIQIIGKQVDGKKHLLKFFNNQTELKRIIKKYDSDKTIFYSFGLALTLSLKLNGCKYYIYEIADILYGYKKFNSLRWLLKYIDKRLINKSILTILTSAGFGNFLFQKKWPENIIVQPNKLNPVFEKLKRPVVKKMTNEKLVFSYVGAFRYPNTIFRFAKIVGDKYTQHQFHFYGDSILTPEVIKLSNAYKNIKYFGPFKNPDDLSSIYENIDIVVASYDIQSLNERIAEPNKLYESLYFQKPIVVSKNTFLAERVNDFGCGFAIDASKDEAIISFIESLNTEKLKEINSNISKISFDEIIDDNSAKIISYLEELLK
jgi:glycosyltransferase involved in cell wall biosynthesis